MKIGDFGKIDDSKKSWPVKNGLNGLHDPHWERIRRAKGLFDNGKEEIEIKKKRSK
jgi:hypothetical protein